MSGKPLASRLRTDLILLSFLNLIGLVLISSVEAQVILPISSLSPNEGETVVGRKPVLRVTLTPAVPLLVPGQLLLSVDGVDVTPQVEIDERTVTYTPVSDLTPGAHSAELTTTDASGAPLGTASWSFVIRDYRTLAEGSMGVELSESFSAVAKKLEKGDPGWISQGNIRVFGTVAEDSFESSLDANIHVIDQQGPGTGGPTDSTADLSEWQFMTRYKDSHLNIGDVEVSESFFLTGEGGFYRRGFNGDTRVFDTDIHLFTVQAEQSIGFNNPAGVSNRNDMVYGGSVSRQILPDDALKLKGVFLKGKSLTADAYNVASVEGPANGTSYGFSTLR